MKLRFLYLAACAGMAICCAQSLRAAPTLDRIHVDLNPLIDLAAHSPERFAVDVPHAISSSTQGTWSTQGSLSTWTYSARIPTAISMSFHATGVRLPASAVLTVGNARTTQTYLARNVSRGGIWGRPLPGDTVNFSLTVNASQASLVRFQIQSLQAGYRSLGLGVPDHPHYLAIRKAAVTTSGCTQNYACNVSTGNQGPSHATVALIISNHIWIRQGRCSR